MSEDTQAGSATKEVKGKGVTQFLMPGAVVIAGALIAGAVLFTNGTPKGESTSDDAPTQVAKKDTVSIAKEDHVFGPKDADVYLIEYSDFKCGYCGLFNETVQKILKEFDGKVAWIYRHTPYQPGGKEVAVASECIAELAGEDAFWSFVERALKSQKDLLKNDWLTQTAGELGADKTKFSECIASGRYDELIATHTMEAQQLGAQGTPFSVLLTKDGEVLKFSGAQPYENVKILVNRALTMAK